MQRQTDEFKKAIEIKLQINQIKSWFLTKLALTVLGVIYEQMFPDQGDLNLCTVAVHKLAAKYALLIHAVGHWEILFKDQLLHRQFAQACDIFTSKRLASWSFLPAFILSRMF